MSPYRAAPSVQCPRPIVPGDLYQPLFPPFGAGPFSVDPALCPPMVVTWFFGGEARLVATAPRLDGRLRMVVKAESLTNPALWKRAS